MSEAYCVLRSTRERGYCAEYWFRTNLSYLMRVSRSPRSFGNCLRRESELNRIQFLKPNISLSRRILSPSRITLHLLSEWRVTIPLPFAYQANALPSELHSVGGEGLNYRLTNVLQTLFEVSLFVTIVRRKLKEYLFFFPIFICAPRRIRTSNHEVNSFPLYRWSYRYNLFCGPCRNRTYSSSSSD